MRTERRTTAAGTREVTKDEGRAPHIGPGSGGGLRGRPACGCRRSPSWTRSPSCCSTTPPTGPTTWRCARRISASGSLHLAQVPRRRCAGSRCGLPSLGLRRGEVVGLIGRNRPNWVWGELAAHALGCMSLGIYEDVLAAEAGYLLDAPRCGVVCAEDEEQVDKLLELDDPPGVRLIVYHDDRGMAEVRRPAAGRLGRAAGRAGQLLARSPACSRPRSRRARARTSRSCARPRAPPRSPSWRCCSTGRSSTHIAAYLRADPREADRRVCLRSCRCPGSWSRSTSSAMPLLCRIRVSFPESRETAMPTCARSGRRTCCWRRASGSRSPPTCARG